MSLDGERVDARHSNKGSTSQSRTERNLDYMNNIRDGQRSNAKKVDPPSPPISKETLTSSTTTSQSKQSSNLGGQSSLLVNSATHTRNASVRYSLKQGMRHLALYQSFAMPPFVNCLPQTQLSMQVEGEKNDKQETKETTQRFVGQSSGSCEVQGTATSEPKKCTTSSRSTKDSVNVNSNNQKKDLTRKASANIDSNMEKKELTGKEKSKAEDKHMMIRNNSNEDYYPFPDHLINMDDYS